MPKELGPNRDWNVDLVPKFMMTNGKLVSEGGESRHCSCVLGTVCLAWFWPLRAVYLAF